MLMFHTTDSRQINGRCWCCIPQPEVISLVEFYVSNKKSTGRSLEDIDVSYHCLLGNICYVFFKFFPRLSSEIYHLYSNLFCFFFLFKVMKNLWMFLYKFLYFCTNWKSKNSVLIRMTSITVHIYNTEKNTFNVKIIFHQETHLKCFWMSKN